MKRMCSSALRPWAQPFALLAAGWLGVCTGSAQGRAAAAVPPAAARPGDELLGEWWTEGNEGRVRFTRQRDGTFVGTTTCCKAEKDVHNPDPKLRARSTLGIALIWALAYQKDGKYENGYVYNPRDGDTYRLDAKLIDPSSLQIRGYLGIPLLGQSQIWKRAALAP